MRGQKGMLDGKATHKSSVAEASSIPHLQEKKQCYGTPGTEITW